MRILFIHQNFPSQFKYLAPAAVTEEGGLAMTKKGFAMTGINTGTEVSFVAAIRKK